MKWLQNAFTSGRSAPEPGTPEPGTPEASAPEASAQEPQVQQADRWAERAEAVHASLIEHYWDSPSALFESHFPATDETGAPFNYWWQAHGLDALLDAYERTQGSVHLERAEALVSGVVARNGGTLHNDYYDDMEWMALSLLRAYALSGRVHFAEQAKDLWADIRGGWNEHMSGGIAWRKSQLDYKNAPANAPAIILAVRMYTAFGDTADLSFARNVEEWMRSNLIDDATGLVWDGVNRQGDGKVDRAWRFSYCQGTYVGACSELFAATGDTQYLDRAFRTAGYAMASLVNPGTGVLLAEGSGDGGLFRGILARYLADLASRNPSEAGSAAIRAFLAANGEAVWRGVVASGLALVGAEWGLEATPPVDLSVHLSGVMLLECLAVTHAAGAAPQ